MRAEGATNTPRPTRAPSSISGDQPMKLEDLETAVVNAILTATRADVNFIEHYLFNLLSVCKEYDRDFKEMSEYVVFLRTEQVKSLKSRKKVSR